MRAHALGAAALAALVGGCAAVPGPVADPLSADERHDLAVLLHARGDHRRAVIEAERAVARRPGWARALRTLGDARLGAGDVEGAIVAYEGAARQDPADPVTGNNLAWALLQHPARWTEAEAVVRRALALVPSNRGHHLDTLGVALLRRGDVAGALDAFRAALAEGQRWAPDPLALLLAHAADAYARLGDAQAAARCRAAAEVVTTAGGIRARDGGSAPGLLVGAGDSMC
jgi:tetratricopeptide (TPR) repeat protein